MQKQNRRQSETYNIDNQMVHFPLNSKFEKKIYKCFLKINLTASYKTKNFVKLCDRVGRGVK